MSNSAPSDSVWPFTVQPSLLTEDIRTRALGQIRKRTRIREPLVETGYWVVTGDPRQGYGLHLRDFSGTCLPAIPLPPSQVRELQVSFCARLEDFGFLRHFTELTGLWLIEVEQLPDWTFLEVMPHLDFFKFRNEVGVVDFAPLRHHRRLKNLEIYSYDTPCSLSFLEGCDGLEELLLAGKFTVEDPDFMIRHFPKLRELWANACTFNGMSVLEPLKQARPELVIHT